MRLICGIVRLDGAPIREKTLDSMLSALTSPGLKPRIARRTQGPAALGVLDFGSDLPPALAVGPDGTWLAADLRLDRPKELAAKLGLPQETCSEDMMFAAVEKWGEDLPDRLDGDFALAAWNPRERRLLCARDILAVRPLCYTYQPGRLFAFASLPRGLHAAGVVPFGLDDLAVARILFASGSRDEATGFADITWLPAGHSAVVTTEGVQLHAAWRPDPARVGTWRGSAMDAAETLRTLIEEAVACRLPAKGPVSAHLSGGLDSSAITVMAARQLRTQNRRLLTYSHLSRPALGTVLLDERPYVDAVRAQEPDIEWSPVYLPPLDSLSVDATDPDLPLSGPLTAPDDWICAASAAAGSQLLLSGAGGDEAATYNGTEILATMAHERRWRSLLAELRARATRSGKPFLRVAATQLLGPLEPDWLVKLLHKWRGLPPPGARRRNAFSFLEPSFAQRLARSLPPEPGWGSRAGDRVQMLTESYLPVRANRWSILGARHGVAFSYPLVDRRILDFVLSLPLERFLDGGHSRQPFRNAMAGILPESIRWRDTKFQPFPDIAANLSASAPGLLARWETIRCCAAAASMFNMNAIGSALSAATDYAVPPAPPGGQPPIPLNMKMAFHAMRALTLSAYVARMTQSSAVGLG